MWGEQESWAAGGRAGRRRIRGHPLGARAQEWLAGWVARTWTGQEGREGVPGGPRVRRGPGRHEDQSGSSASPQETGVPEELLVTVVRPGLPTLADLYVLLPSPRPTRKRSITSDKVCAAATSPGPPCTA